MRGKFEIVKPDDVEMTMTMTLTLGQWKKLRDKMQDKYIYPMSDFVDTIDDMVRQAERTFCGSPKDKDQE